MNRLELVINATGLNKESFFNQYTAIKHIRSIACENGDHELEVLADTMLAKIEGIIKNRKRDRFLAGYGNNRLSKI